jgi:hypothetical protein
VPSATITCPTASPYVCIVARQGMRETRPGACARAGWV